MYKVKVTGDYVARSGVMEREKVRKAYEIDGVIPTLTGALSIVKNKLLGPALSKKYPDYVTFLTYNIVEISPMTPEAKDRMGKVEVVFMDRDTLIKHIKDLALPVEHRYFPDLFKLREAVQLAKEDEAGYLKWFENRKEDLELDLQMAAANPELFKQQPTDPNFIASIQVNTKKKKASSPEVLEVKTEERLDGLKADMARDGEIEDLDL